MTFPNSEIFYLYNQSKKKYLILGTQSRGLSAHIDTIVLATVDTLEEAQDVCQTTKQFERKPVKIYFEVV